MHVHQFMGPFFVKITFEYVWYKKNEDKDQKYRQKVDGLYRINIILINMKGVYMYTRLEEVKEFDCL